MSTSLSTPQLVSIIIPCYNEELNIAPLYQEIVTTLEKSLIYNFEILFVDDGSSDNTVSEVKKVSLNDQRVRCIVFSRNFGNQCALRAGLEFASGNLIASIDCDLQQPPEILLKMISKIQEGYDMVLTRRVDKQVDLRVLAAKFFYTLINIISSFPISYGSSDFRMINRKVLKSLMLHKEYYMFFRGIIPQLGFKQYTIDYEARERASGKSKLTLKKLINLAIDGITSSSILPLRLSTFLGIAASLLAFLYLSYALYSKIVFNNFISGWTSLIISVLFLGGIQLIVLGIIGEYLGKIFFEVKKRPPYIITTIINDLSSRSSGTHEDR